MLEKLLLAASLTLVLSLFVKLGLSSPTPTTGGMTTLSQRQN